MSEDVARLINAKKAVVEVREVAGIHIGHAEITSINAPLFEITHNPHACWILNGIRLHRHNRIQRIHRSNGLWCWLWARLWCWCWGWRRGWGRSRRQWIAIACRAIDWGEFQQGLAIGITTALVIGAEAGAAIEPLSLQPAGR